MLRIVHIKGCYIFIVLEHADKNMTFEILICDHFWIHIYSLNAIEYIFNNEKECDKWPVWAEQRDLTQ